MSLVGISNLHYAIQKTDTLTGATYDTPVYVEGFMNVDIKTGSQSGTLFADNQPKESKTIPLGDASITIEMKDIPLAAQAALLGSTLEKGVLHCKTTDKAPYVALLFESLKANDTNRYMKILKVKFQTPDDSIKTQDDKITFQSAKLIGKIVARTYDKEWKRMADEDATDYEASTGTAWYTTVDPTV